MFQFKFVKMKRSVAKISQSTDVEFEGVRAAAIEASRIHELCKTAFSSCANEYDDFCDKFVVKTCYEVAHCEVDSLLYTHLISSENMIEMKRMNENIVVLAELVNPQTSRFSELSMTANDIMCAESKCAARIIYADYVHNFQAFVLCISNQASIFAKLAVEMWALWDKISVFQRRIAETSIRRDIDDFEIKKELHSIVVEHNIVVNRLHKNYSAINMDVIRVETVANMYDASCQKIVNNIISDIEAHSID